MMNRRGQILVVATLLGVALCADRAISAAPALPPTLTRAARAMASRFTRSFVQNVRVTRMYETRTVGVISQASRAVQPANAVPSNQAFAWAVVYPTPPPAV